MTSEEAQQRGKKHQNLKPLLAKKLHEFAQHLDGLESEEELDVPQFMCNSVDERIRQGFLRFKDRIFLKRQSLFNILATRQNPQFLVIACSDSRVCPITILSLQPGEAFVIRNVANMVPPWEKSTHPGVAAGLEYGVMHLKIPNIFVIGHSRCGGISALMSQSHNDAGSSQFIQDWIKIGNPARRKTFDVMKDRSHDQQCTYCEKESVNVSLRNLLSYPWINNAVRSKQTSLLGGYYDFIEGSFEHWRFDGRVNHIEKY